MIRRRHPGHVPSVHTARSGERSLRSALLAAAAAISLTACKSTDPVVVVGGHELRPRTYGLVVLRNAQEPPTLTGTEAQDALAGHMQFMQDLGSDGTLLVAGPFGAEKADARLSGLFLLDEDSVSRARSVAAEDPTTQLGVFEQEVLPLVTLDVLRFLPEMYRAELEANRIGEEGPQEPVLRSYSVLFAEDGERVFRLLSGEVLGPKLILAGRLGGKREGELFAVLDIESPKLVGPYLIAAAGGNEVEGVEVSQWFASPALGKLGTEGPPPAE